MIKVIAESNSHHPKPSDTILTASSPTQDTPGHAYSPGNYRVSTRHIGVPLRLWSSFSTTVLS